MAKFCTNCGAVLSDTRKFCTECGTPVPEDSINEGRSAQTSTANLSTPDTTHTVQEKSTIQDTKIQQTPQQTQQQAQQATQQTQRQQTQTNYQQSNYQQTPTYQQSTQYQQQTSYQQMPPLQNNDAVIIPGSKYEPISTWGYIGIMLLMCIPVVGFILVLVWAFGGCRKLNKRNLARASLIMTVISIIIAVIIGFAVKSFIDGIKEDLENSLGISFSEIGNSNDENGDDIGDIGDILGGLLDGDTGNSASLGDLNNLLDILGSANGENNSENNAINSGNNSGTNNNGNSNNNSGNLDDVFDTIDDINQEAEAQNNGWPSSLRKYPGGTSKAVSSYRTEITGTSLDEMKSWIEDLKKDGFKYEDFYEFGFSEEDMLSLNGWWATDGKIYLSLSCSSDTVTVDHLNELPDMSDLFG